MKSNISWKWKLLICFFSGIVMFLPSLFANPLATENPGANVEIFLTNNTSSTISVHIAPIGMIFNDLKEYSLTSSSEHKHYKNKNITGITISVPAGKRLFPIVNHIATPQRIDGQPGITQNHLDNHIGYGRYRVNIEVLNIFTWGYVDVDFTDADYSYDGSSGVDNDIWLRIEEPDPGEYALYWDGGTPYLLTPNEDLIEIWDQTRIGKSSKTQNKEGFKILSNSNIPMQASGHITPGKLFVNLDFQGDATVASGKSFLPQPGVSLNFISGAKLAVNGTLTASGTSSNPITFTRNGSSGTWDGIQFNSGSSGTVEHATIKYAKKGVHIKSTNNVTVKNCTIENFTEQGIYAEYAAATIDNNTIKNPSGASHGIYVKGKPGGSAGADIKNNTLQDIAIGIEVNDDDNWENHKIHSNTIKKCTDGVKLYITNAEIYNNYIDGGNASNHGIRILLDAVPDIHETMELEQRAKLQVNILRK